MLSHYTTVKLFSLLVKKSDDADMVGLYIDEVNSAISAGILILIVHSERWSKTVNYTNFFFVIRNILYAICVLFHLYQITPLCNIG